MRFLSRQNFDPNLFNRMRYNTATFGTERISSKQPHRKLSPSSDPSPHSSHRPRATLPDQDADDQPNSNQGDLRSSSKYFTDSANSSTMGADGNYSSPLTRWSLPVPSASLDA